MCIYIYIYIFIYMYMLQIYLFYYMCISVRMCVSILHVNYTFYIPYHILYRCICIHIERERDGDTRRIISFIASCARYDRKRLGHHVYFIGFCALLRIMLAFWPPQNLLTHDKLFLETGID